MAQALVGTGSVMLAQARFGTGTGWHRLSNVGTGTGWHRYSLVRKGLDSLLKSSRFSEGGFVTEANMAMA